MDVKPNMLLINDGDDDANDDVTLVKGKIKHIPSSRTNMSFYENKANKKEAGTPIVKVLVLLCSLMS